jgi:hypothetical protein
MNARTVILMAGVAVALPCHAQFFGVSPAVSDTQIRAMVEQMLPQLELLEQYQMQLNEIRQCQVLCEARQDKDGQETHRDSQAAGNH